MKVKVGDVIYDGKEQPVMVILSDQDKENIKNMGKDYHSYACFPDHYKDTEAMKKWMRLK